MAKFIPEIKLSMNTQNSDSCKLGEKDKELNDKDRNKAVKYSTTIAGTVVLCEAGDKIDGFIHSVESFTQDGQSFGQVWRKGPQVRQRVTSDAALNLGDFVVSGAQEAAQTNTGPARHTLNNIGLTKVQAGGDDAGWRVINVVDEAARIYLIEAV